MMANCRLIRMPPSALAEGAKNTFDYGGFAKPILPKNAHHITTGPNGLPKVIDDGKKRYRADGDRRSGGARSTMPYNHFDGLVDLQNSSGLVKLVSTKPTACIYPTSIGLPVEGMGAAAAQDFKGIVEPISIFKVSDNVHNISTSPQNFSNPPRALQTCALGDPTRYLPLSIGDGNFSDKNLHDPGLTPRGKKLSSSLALKNDEVVATHISPAITKTVKNIQAKHTTLVVENMDCNEESTLSMGEKDDRTSQFFSAHFDSSAEGGCIRPNANTPLPTDVEENSKREQYQENLFFPKIEKSKANSVLFHQKKDEKFCPKLKSDDTDINEPHSHQETAVVCEEKNHEMELELADENLNLIGYKIEFENNNLTNLIFIKGKFNPKLFEMFKNTRANTLRALYNCFNNEVSQLSRSKLSNLINIAQNGLKVADVLHKKHLLTKMFEEEETTNMIGGSESDV